MIVAPLGWLRLQAFAHLVVLFAWLGMLAGVFARLFTGSDRAAISALIAAAAWWVGVAIVTRPRPVQVVDGAPERELFWTRSVARLLTACVAVPLGVLVLTAEGHAWSTGAPAWAWPAVDVALIAAALGLFAFGLVMLDLAHWAADYQCQPLWRSAAVAVVISAGAVVFGRHVNLTSGLSLTNVYALPGGFLFVVLCVIFVAAPLMLFTYALARQWQTANWAVTNHLTHEQREERLRERAESTFQAQQAAGPPDIVPHVHLASTAPSKHARYNPRTMIPGPAPKRVKFVDPDHPLDAGAYGLADSGSSPPPEGAQAGGEGPGAQVDTRPRPGFVNARRAHVYNPRSMTPGPAPKRVDLRALDDTNPNAPGGDTGRARPDPLFKSELPESGDDVEPENPA